MKIYDITPLISEEIAVFPGDQAYERQIDSDIATGDSFSLSHIITTLHLGAHTDAPNHYHAEGRGIHEQPLDYYIGPCQVITAPPKDAPHRLICDDLADTTITQSRVLFKTESFPDVNHWQADFTALSPELIHMLREKGVKLVGIDTPSIDPADAKELISHAAIYKNDMAILEGIVLSAVPDGEYTLIALPLKLLNADASPVRAVLIESPKAFTFSEDT